MLPDPTAAAAALSPIHEAAHAVVAEALGVAVRGVEAGTVNVCRLDPEAVIPYRHQVLILLAGGVAEAYAFPELEWLAVAMSANDHAQASDVLTAAGLTGDLRARVAADCVEATWVLVDESWPAIEELAGRLADGPRAARTA